MRSLLLVCSWLACAAAAPSSARFEPEPYHAPPAHWVRGARVPSHHTLEMTFALRQRNIDALEETLLRVSDPQHADYGAHLDLDEVSALVAPAPATLATVREWLSAHGAHVHEGQAVGEGEFLVARLTLAAAERMLQTRYHHFELATGAGGRTAGAARSGVVRAGAPYSLPAHLAAHIDFVSPGHSFMGLGAQVKALGGRMGVGPDEWERLAAAAAAGGGEAAAVEELAVPAAAAAEQPQHHAAGAPQRLLREAVLDTVGDGGDDDGNSWGSTDSKPAMMDNWVMEPETVTPQLARRWYHLGDAHSTDIAGDVASGKRGTTSVEAFKCVGLSADGSPPAPKRRLGGAQQQGEQQGEQQQQQQQQQKKKGHLVFGWAPVNFLREKTDIADSYSDFFKVLWPQGRAFQTATGGKGGGKGGEGADVDTPAVRRMGTLAAGENIGAMTRTNQVKTGVEATGEATMDLQFGALMGAGTHVVVWSTSGHSPDPYTTQSNHEPNEPWLKWMVQTGREKCSPALFTISYADNESSCTHKWAHRANIELMKMGVRGISVFAATGDEGVGGAWVEDCKGALLGTWPAGSPYITAVGGTRRHVEVQGEGGNLAPKCKPGFVSYVNAIVPPHDSPAEPKVPPPVCLKEFEYGSTQSAGGFSWFFKRPKYQRAAVGHFLKAHKDKLPAQHGTYARRFNWRHGRAYPDLCAFSEGNVMLYGDKSQNGDGTSASTPLTAGIFALLNDARKKAGKPPLGFVNPLIYQNPQAFRDITSGTNPGCGIPGFQCTPGWDPVTGMGSPLYDKLLEVVQKLR